MGVRRRGAVPEDSRPWRHQGTEAGAHRQLSDEGDLRLDLGFPGRPARGRTPRAAHPAARISPDRCVAHHAHGDRGAGELDQVRGKFARYRASVLRPQRSEEHTSELQSLMRISYAVFCLKKKKQTTTQNSIGNAM